MRAGVPPVRRRNGGGGLCAAQLLVEMDGSDIASARSFDRPASGRRLGAAPPTRPNCEMRLEHELQTVW